jgi:DNA-binding MarR family transcriptional regulator
MDAGAVSRAIRLLEERGLVVPLAGRFAGRSRPYAMTPPGVEVYAAMKASALAREQQLLVPLSDTERRELLRLLGRLYDGLDDIDV